jgi:peptidyl-prolyl cis-trans isomerase D
MVRGAVLFLKSSSKATPEKRAELADWAAQLLAQSREANEAGFVQLIQQYSEDQATRYAGGDTGWLRRAPADTGWDPAVCEALFALGQAGQFSPVITTAQGFYLVRLTEKKPAQTKPLAEVKEEIRHRLAREREQQRQHDFAQAMRRGLQITINQPLLESLPAPAAGSQTKPPSGPSGQPH